MIQVFLMLCIAGTYLFSGIFLFEHFDERGAMWWSIALVFPAALFSMVIVRTGTPAIARESLRHYEAFASRAANQLLVLTGLLHVLLFALTFGQEFLKDFYAK